MKTFQCELYSGDHVTLQLDMKHTVILHTYETIVVCRYPAI